MLRKSLSFLLIVFVLGLITYPSPVRSQKSAPPRQKKTLPTRDDSSCYTCHELIKFLKEGNKHGALPCSKCHGKLISE